MGTNYYVPIDKECPDCGKSHLCREGMHIGKSSFGWKFLFAFNGGEYYKNLDELKSFIEDKKIWNEYGEEVTHEEFWHLVKVKQEAEEPESVNNFATYVMNIDGYRFMDGEFS